MVKTVHVKLQLSVMRSIYVALHVKQEKAWTKQLMNMEGNFWIYVWKLISVADSEGGTCGAPPPPLAAQGRKKINARTRWHMH